METQLKDKATLYIDADACPVKKEAISLGRAYGLCVVLVGNGTQNFERYIGRKGVRAITVSSGRDSADFAIIERLCEGDVVVTQDIGVAAMALGKNAHAISPRGRIFHLATIDAQMELRHAEAKMRRAGKRTGGPSKFTEDDRMDFIDGLDRILSHL